jgi:Ca-activated chloride channel homolog
MSQTCAVALLLLLDVSGSVSTNNYELQKHGIVEAFSDINLRKTIAKLDRVAISVLQWSNNSKISIPWTILSSEEDISVFVDSVKNMTRSFSGDTALAKALEQGISYFEKTPCEADNKIIDISGDGKETLLPIEEREKATNAQRDRASELYITINGLPILAVEKDIVDWYRTNVITQDGFLIAAENYDDFGRAIKLKLIREIAEKTNGKI